MSEQKSKAALYREMMRSRELETVDITAPSGMVFTFEKPSRYGILFGLGELPQMAASGAAEQWAKDGVFNPETVSDENKIALAKTAMDTAQRVLDLSIDPKLVAGKAKGDNELSVQDLDSEDLEFLFKWVSSGGVEAESLSSFSQRREQMSVAGTNGAKLRATAKRNSRHKK